MVPAGHTRTCFCWRKPVKEGGDFVEKWGLETKPSHTNMFYFRDLKKKYFLRKDTGHYFLADAFTAVKMYIL
jgi:hypothetical protein